jgi:hypothetical protein
MSSYDIAEAIAFERIEPFGEYREDLRAALIASTIANCNRSSKSKPFSLSDFMLDFSEKKKRTVEDDIREAFGLGDYSSKLSD